MTVRAAQQSLLHVRKHMGTRRSRVTHRSVPTAALFVQWNVCLQVGLHGY